MRFQWLSITCFVLLIMSCSDDTEVGYGLVEGEDLEIEFRDDIELIAKTIDNGPFQTYSFGSLTLTSLFLGEMDDPDFGKLKSDVYFSTSILTSASLDFAGGTYDSLVLTIRIDSSLSNGSSLVPHNISVHQLSNAIIADSLDSSNSFETETALLGSKDGIIPSEIDSVRVPDGNSDSTFTNIVDIIRIPLDDRLGNALFADTSAHASITDIREKFAGIRISDETENSLFGIRNTSYITLYYHDSENNFREYIYFLNVGPLTSHISHDYAGTPIETLLDVPVSESNNLYLQGLSGTDVSIDISAIHDLGDLLINHASLEFFIVDDEGRDTLLYPSATSVFLQEDSEAGLIDIEDVLIARDFIGDIRHFGGLRVAETEKNKIKYEMNITTHLIDVMKRNAGDILYLRIGSKTTTPTTAVLYGPNHPEFPARLKLTYTKS